MPIHATHHPKRKGGLAGALALLAAFGASAALAAPPGTVPFGVYDPGGDFSTDPDVTIEHLFLPWEDVYLPSLQDADAYAQARGRVLMITIEPWTWSRSERNTPEYLQRGIAAGEYDENMRAICQIIATLKSSVSVRWGHEMEDKSSQFIWTHWDPATYISAYKRMIDVCRAEAPGIRTVWSPLGDEGMEQYYPGDDYVDLVGISVFGYQPWEKAILGKERGYLEVMAPKYERAAQFGKPVIVAELGYSGTQDYVDAWEKEVRVERPEFGSLVGVAYFDQKEVYPWPDGFGLPDWRVNERVLPAH